MTKDNFFRTPDMSLAVTLSLFANVEFIDRSNPQKAVFWFHRSPELEEIIAKYWKNELRVNPIDYANQTKNLKTRIYQE